MTNGFHGTIATEAIQIVNHGPKSTRWNLVILGEGYQEAELLKYHADIDTILAALQAKVPFNDLWPCINVFRIDVTSTDSFLEAHFDNPKLTYYNSYFTDAEPYVVFHMDEARAYEDGVGLVPEAHVVLVLVNFTAWTIGHAGAPVVACVQKPDITIHEIGHMCGLADEFWKYSSCYSGAEPDRPNVTLDCNRDTIKWADLIDPQTPMPSSCKPDSPDCDDPENPITTPGIVGAFEGAYYYKFCIYRPTLECCMAWDEDPFCKVCDRAIREALAPFGPDPEVETSDFVIESPNVHTNYKKVIHLKGDFGVAFLYFVPESEALGANRKRPNRNLYDVYFPMNSWSQCVDLLRNEKPVYFYYDVSNNTAVIKTSDEPIGEEESETWPTV